MTAISHVLKAVTIATVAAWLGIMLFFSFFVAPLAFATDRVAAARLVPLLLPRYYGVGGVLCAMALVALLMRGLRTHLARALLCGVMLAMTALALAWLVPLAEAARAGNDHVTFIRAHRLSVGLNLATMLAALLVLVLEAWRPDR